MLTWEKPLDGQNPVHLNGCLSGEKTCIHFHMCLYVSLLWTLIAQVWHPCLVSDCEFHASRTTAKHIQLCASGTHPYFHFYFLGTQVLTDTLGLCAGLEACRGEEVSHLQQWGTFVTHFKRSRDCPCPFLIPAHLHSLNSRKPGR